MIDPEVIAQRAAVRLQVPAAELVPVATAALEYIAADISSTVDDLEPGALIDHGAMLLTERIYLDVPTRSGDLDPFGSVTMTGVVIPEDLGRHLRHYWTPTQTAWGIA